MATLTIAAIGNAAEAGLVVGQFLITTSEAPTSDLTVSYRVETSSTATAVADYTALTGTATILANQTTATINVNPVNDTLVEVPETVIVTLLDGVDYDLGATTQATVTIASDDTNVSLAVSPTSVQENGTTNLVYTFTREGVTSNALTVNFNVGGTALVSDYTQTDAATFTVGGAGTVTFAPGETTATVTIDPTGDTTVETDETVALTLAAGTGGNTYTIVTPGVVTGTIANDDTDVTLAVAPGAVLEDGTPNLVYTFTRTGVTSNPLTVNFTVGGTSTFNTDYVPFGATAFDATTGSITFASGSSTATLTIDPTADTARENDETVALTLAAGTGLNTYTIGTTPAVTGTITNDDSSITLAVAPATGAEGTGATAGTNLVYTFTRLGSITNALTVNFTVGGTATFGGSGADYAQTGAATFSATTGTVTFAATDNLATLIDERTTATVTIDPIEDATGENDETVALTLAAGTGYTIDTTATVTGTITNDDLPAITLAVAPASVQEDGTTNLVYTFTRTGATTAALTVNFTESGTADDADYTQTGAVTFADGTVATPGAGTVTFAVGSATATVTIDPTLDTTPEDNETVVLTLVDQPANYTRTTTGGVTGTIANDDTTVTLAVSPASVQEDGTTNLVYTFTRTVTTNALTVNYTVGGGATFGTDYTQTGASAFSATTGSVTFAAGAATATVTIDPTGDTTVEGDETVALTLAAGTNNNVYTIGTPAAATGTITNDDTNVTLAVAPGTVNEDGTTNLVYTFTRDTSLALLATPLTVSYNVGGDATFNTDYTQVGAATFSATAGTVTFIPGSLTATITIDPTPDTTAEQDETVALTLVSGTGYTIGTTTVEGTIADDDATVTLAVSPSSVQEDGTQNLVYTFTRAGAINNPLTVNYTVGGTASFGGGNPDYTQTGATAFNATTGSVTFASGSNTATVTIDPTQDTTAEPDETVALTLAAGTGYQIGTTAAVTGTIANDETQITLAVSPASVQEDGATNLVYTFTRTGLTTNALTVNYTVAGAAEFGTDYTQTGASDFTSTTGTVTFAAGSSTATVTIDPTPDTAVEGNQDVALTLAAGTGYTIGTGGAVVGTINNDDTSITLAVSPFSVNEDGGNLVYTFTRAGVTTNALTVNFNVGGDATFGTDYSQIGADSFNSAVGTVTFAANNTTATVTIDPTTDTTVELDETVGLTLASGTGYTIGTETQVTGTIANDDNDAAIVTLAVSPTRVLENGTQNLIYTFTRTGVIDNPLTVDFTVGGTATFGAANDYTAIGAATFNAGAGSVTFASNSATATVTIDPVGNTVVEQDETVALTLANGAGYVRGTTTAITGTIADDDSPRITLAVSPSSVQEDGTPNLVYTFTRTITTSSLVVNFSVGGTAILNTDYTQSGATTFTETVGTATFAAGAATTTVTINPTPDTTLEPNETVDLILTAGAGYVIDTIGAVTGTIANDDTTVTLAVSPGSALEDGTGNLVYTFSRTGATDNALTVNFTESGTATNDDYTQTGAATFADGTLAAPGAGTVTFAAGAATATVTIDPTVDSTIEPNETVALTLATGTGYAIGTSTAVTGTITDDDLAGISLAVSPASILEDGTSTLAYTFTRVGSTTNPLTVNFTVGGTATFDTDYTQTGAATFNGGGTGTVTFAAGSSTATVTIDSIADTIVEQNETVNLTLADGTGYTRTTTTAVSGTIANDDTGVTLSVSPASVQEDGTANLIYTFTREGVTSNALTVNFTVGGTASVATDYLAIGGASFTETTGSITFASGSNTATLTIDPTVDTVGEDDETVVLTLADGTGYTRTTTTGVTGTIANDDVAVPSISLALSPTTVEEDGTENLVYTFTRTLTANALVVNYSVGGTAILTDDYTVIGATSFTETTGTVNFGAGQATATIAINPTADTTVEESETVVLTLVSDANYAIGTTAGVTGTIADDDSVLTPVVTIAATDDAASEQPGNPGEFTVTLSEAPTADLELAYTVSGTATSGTDYTALSGTVTVLAGATTATIAVLPVEDALVEGLESVILTLTDGEAYDLGAATTATATVTIADSVITDIDGNTDINDADIALIVDYLLGATPGDLQATFNQYSSLTEGASNTTGDALETSIEAQLSLFDIDRSGETTTADMFVINSYLLFQQSFNGNRPAIENQLALLAEDLSVELTGPNTTGPGLYTALNALFA